MLLTNGFFSFIKNRRKELFNEFEVGGKDRVLPMEGLRAIAVGLVFMQHYSKQYLIYGKLTGFTRQFGELFANIGNYGVELFFVLSGFLIYGILLRRRPPFFSFMARRARRLYPAFMAALVFGVCVDPWRPHPKIPHDLLSASAYIFENIAFLPGLFPIDPLFSVNWSLSYEWWFYVTATFIFSVCGITAARPAIRVCGIVGAIVILLVCSAKGVPYTPIRGTCLLGGMLLAEAREARLPGVPGILGIILAFSSLVGCAAIHHLPSWAHSFILMIGFCALCSGALSGSDPIVTTPLSWKYLRLFGNISYSYYLIHGFVVESIARLILYFVGSGLTNWVFWAALLPIFFATVLVGASVFLCIEKPFSLSRNAVNHTNIFLTNQLSPRSHDERQRDPN